jgi:type II secretory pathway component PulM
MNRIQQLLNEASAAFTRLSGRERTMVLAGGGGALLLLILVITLSTSSAISKREARIRVKSTQLEEVVRLTGNYRQVELERNELERRLRGNQVRLFSLLDELSKKLGVEIGGMNDKGTRPLEETRINETSVEVTFTRISLEKLVKFLSEVEGSSTGLVKVSRLQLRPRANESVLDAWMVVSTYQLEGAG